MKKRLNKILAPLASLKLTVTLLVLGMILIFAGTTVQGELGIWDVQRRFFHAWVTIIEWRLFFPLWDWGIKNIPGAIPFPGGYTLILLLLANLLAAHTVRFKMSWKRSGIFFIHAGLILLLVGEVVTAEGAREGQMTIDVGGSSNYTSDIREPELAIIDPSPADFDDEIIIPVARLARHDTIVHPKLPFSVRIDDFYPNSDILGPQQAGSRKDARATAGTGKEITLIPASKFSGTDASSVDVPSAYVTLTNSDGNAIGTYLVTTIELLPQFPPINQPQMFKVGDKEYWLQLRFKREYKPYTIQLTKFTHDVYQGTNTPKNFASLIHLTDPSQNVDREALIWMNHPLRYAGQTFYQSGFDKQADRFTILQVVKNPGWLIPYISCSMVALGLLIHFGMHLMTFLSRVRDGRLTLTKPGKPSKVQAKPSMVPAAVITALCAIYMMAIAFPGSALSGVDLFARVPVSFEGRTMPLDSLARNSLRVLSGRSQVTVNDESKPAISWLLDVFSRPQIAAGYKVFRVDLPDIKNLLGLDENQKLFSFDEILAKKDVLSQQIDLASHVADKKRDLYQRKIMELYEHLSLFNHLAQPDDLYLSPPLESTDWRPLAKAMEGVAADKLPSDPGASAFLQMIGSVAPPPAEEMKTTAAGMPMPSRANDAAALEELRSIASRYQAILQSKLPDVAKMMDAEVLFNRADPFINCMGLYVIVFLLAAVSWLKWHGPLSRAALWVLVFAAIVHTLGLGMRIYLQGRPPVTNLYSSAVFIAWGAVMFCIALELIYRNGVASAAAGAIAFPSLLIAHYLSGSGDTMQMLQAVLDTNIWLATHVVVVTLGYTATFLSGFLAIAYVLGGVATKAMTTDVRKTLVRMVYGVVCFAMLFSFVGTVLGGIWADQSWGRFWGWDPKENGAVLIVLWNAIILHSRWGGLVQERGFMLLAVAGNIVTSWSWFGTNMLGIGLHSYGFMDSALFWLVAFDALQLAIIAVGLLPVELWRSLGSSRGLTAKPA